MKVFQHTGISTKKLPVLVHQCFQRIETPPDHYQLTSARSLCEFMGISSFFALVQVGKVFTTESEVYFIEPSHDPFKKGWSVYQRGDHRFIWSVDSDDWLDSCKVMARAVCGRDGAPYLDEVPADQLDELATFIWRFVTPDNRSSRVMQYLSKHSMCDSSLAPIVVQIDGSDSHDFAAIFWHAWETERKSTESKEEAPQPARRAPTTAELTRIKGFLGKSPMLPPASKTPSSSLKRKALV